MEPKLKVVDWDKVTGTGGVGMIIGGSQGQREGVWSQKLQLFMAFAGEMRVGSSCP